MQNNKIQYVFLMAGKSQRFVNEGYQLPKALLPITKDKKMIDFVVNNIKTNLIDGETIFVCREEDYITYDLYDLLPWCKNRTIHPIKYQKDGALASFLQCRKILDDEGQLLIVNTDQWVQDFNPFWFQHWCRNHSNADFVIPHFKAIHPKWSFIIRSNEEPREIIRIAEKDPISDEAIVGIYYCRKTKQFLEAADEAVRKDTRTNNEFYIAPTFNEMIAKGLVGKGYQIEYMHGLGTPEDYKTFIEIFRD